MEIAELKREMDTGFAGVKEQFAQVDERFAQTDQRISDEAEKTRRHFDVAMELMKTERNLVLDHSLSTAQKLDALRALNAAGRRTLVKRLDDHEQRLTKLEDTRSSDR